MQVPTIVLERYGLHPDLVEAEVLRTGLINHTWKITTGGMSYILQRVNESVFTSPADIASNMELIGDYLSFHHPDYTFVGPVKSVSNEQLIQIHGADAGYYRMFPFVENSHSQTVVQTPEQAYEAAAQFGRFTHVLSGFDVHQLKITLPHFHDLSFRFHQFRGAMENGSSDRLKQSAELVAIIKQHADIVTEYEKIQGDRSFIKRVTHHDTKISNVLFDDAGKGLCVIDLDTVMPGHFISDVGDMMRTYLPAVSEEADDFNTIEVRDEVYHAIVQGYHTQMGRQLTHVEKSYYFYAGKFMIYMQALRFLTDHLNNDVYYGARYPGQNFTRAGNQLVLLRKLLAKEKHLLVAL